MAGTFKHLKATVETIAGTPRYIPGGDVKTGTVTSTIGSNSIVGVGTTFRKDVKEGDILIIDLDYKVEVIDVTNNTTLRIKEVATETKSAKAYATYEWNALEFEAIFTVATGAIEGEDWVVNVPWKMKNDYGIEPILFSGTGTITYLEPSSTV